MINGSGREGAFSYVPANASWRFLYALANAASGFLKERFSEARGDVPFGMRPCIRGPLSGPMV